MQMIQDAMFLHGNDQHRLDHTPGADIPSGRVVNINNRIGVVTSPEGLKNGKLGSVAVAGVFLMKKAAGAGVVLSPGVAVYWHIANRTAVASPGAGIIRAGLAVAHGAMVGANGDDRVAVDINAVENHPITTTTTT